MRPSVVSIMIIICMLLFSGCRNENSISYMGDKYVYLDCPADIFYYDLNHSISYAEDETYPLDSSQWEMVYNSGDIFCIRKHVREAEAYYADDSNYEWKFVVEHDDREEIYPIEIQADAVKDIYELDDAEKNMAIYFEEIDRFGSLIKVSKDGMIKGVINLAEFEGDWYWRTEIIDDSREKDGSWPEYIIKIPSSINAEMKELCK